VNTEILVITSSRSRRSHRAKPAGERAPVPGHHGGFRSPSVLNKPFADVADALGLGKAFTQRGLRRTFNDLARAAQVEGIVTRSISGHVTERIQEHYSTVHEDEQRAGIARVISLFGGEH
jgi:hypothetical protein